MIKTDLFAEYPSHHADRRDRARHIIGIPAIVLPIAVLISYAAIDPGGAVISLVVFAVLYFVAIRLSWQISTKTTTSKEFSNRVRR